MRNERNEKKKTSNEEGNKTFFFQEVSTYDIQSLYKDGRSQPLPPIMQTTRDTIYDILRRWATEGYAGLDDKSHAPHNPARKVTIREMNEVKKLASNPDLGATRVTVYVQAPDPSSESRGPEVIAVPSREGERVDEHAMSPLYELPS